MTERVNRVYQFGPFRLDLEERELRRQRDLVALTPKAFDTLVVLVQNSGRVIEKDDLMKRVWPDTFVEEANLAVNISVLRKALGSTPTGGQYIETVPRRGYRFSPQVTDSSLSPVDIVVRERVRSRMVIDEEDGQRRSPGSRTRCSIGCRPPRGTSRSRNRHAKRPETHYARSGDVNIAYQVVGDGPIDLVFVMGWVSHVEYFWAEPSFARFLSRLASFSRLILFDKRGTGLSDRVPLNQLPTLEQRMDDVRAVMDAVGSERAALCGISEGRSHVQSVRRYLPGEDDCTNHDRHLRETDLGPGVPVGALPRRSEPASMKRSSVTGADRWALKRERRVWRMTRGFESGGPRICEWARVPGRPWR